MKVIESAVEGIPLIVVEGDLDQSSKPAVLEALHSILREAHSSQNLLIDLTDCAFIDSGGLGVLLTAMALLPSGCWLGIIGAAAGPNRVLEYTGFLDHEKVRFFSSRNGAAASVAHERKQLLEERGRI